MSAADREALNQLMDLLEEGGDNSGDEEQNIDDPWRRKPNLKIRSMPQFRKNKWLGVFLDLVQDNLEEVNWLKGTHDNLSSGEQLAL